MALKNFKLFRGNSSENTMQDYSVKVDEGMVVLDAILRIQAHQAGDFAVRWNCKAGKCGSCSVEINGKPKLACMTRMNEYDDCLLYTSPSPRDRSLSRMPSSA